MNNPSFNFLCDYGKKAFTKKDRYLSLCFISYAYGSSWDKRWMGF